MDTEKTSKFKKVAYETHKSQEAALAKGYTEDTILHANIEDKDAAKLKCVSLYDFKDDFIELSEPGADYVFPTLTKVLDGYALGAINMLFAGAGSGKTTITQHELVNLKNQGIKVTLISTEESPRKTIKNVLRAAGYTTLDGRKTDSEAVNQAKVEAMKEAMRAYLSDGLIQVPESLAAISLETICPFIRKAAADGCKHFFIDSITKLSCSVSSEAEQWRAIETAVINLADLVRELNIHILLIGHTREKKKDLSLYSIKGGQAASNFCDNIMVLYQADMPPKLGKDGEKQIDYKVIEILKARDAGEALGLRIGVEYNLVSKCLKENPTVVAFEPEDRTKSSKPKVADEVPKKEKSAKKEKSTKTKAQDINTDFTEDGSGSGGFNI